MQDSQRAGPKPPSRRGVILGAASIGAAVTAVAALPKVSEPPAVTASVLPPAPEKGGGYSLSEHVKRYYKTTSA
jgi:hypothetical protein